MEIIDLTNSPSTPKARAKRTPSSSQNTLRPKPVIRKLSMSDNVWSQPLQLVVRRNVPGKLINPDKQPQNPQIQNHIMHEPGSGSQTADHSRQNYGAVPKESWSEIEHQLSGVIKHALGSWSTIAKEFVSTKTPHQVAIYAESFFKRLQKPFLYNLGFKRTKQLPTIIPRREMDMNLPPPSDLDNSSSSKPSVPAAMATPAASGSNSPAPQKLDKYTSLFFPLEASSNERSAKTTPPVEPEKPVSLRALAEEPEPMKISLALPVVHTNLPEFERDNEMEEEELNLELTLGRGGTS